MKAIVYSAFGPASGVLHLVDLPTPSPAAGEVLVRLRYSGVNPSDVKARAGARPGVTKPPFPQIVPHSDGAGVIEAVGEGVDPARIGQRVWVWNGQWQRPYGTCAEYTALPQDQAVPLPEGVSDQVGAVLGIPGLTATYVVLGAGPVAGKTVLVSGGAGMVGHLAVQIAKASGARVIATASPAKHQILRECGADVALDYAAPDLAEKIIQATDGHGIDHAAELEFGANAALLTQVMAPNSRIMAYGSAQVPTPEIAFLNMMFKAITLESVLIYLQTPDQRARTIAALTDLLTAGHLHPRIGPVFDMADTAQAHDAVAQNSRQGAVLVKVG